MDVLLWVSQRRHAVFSASTRLVRADVVFIIFIIMFITVSVQYLNKIFSEWPADVRPEHVLSMLATGDYKHYKQRFNSFLFYFERRVI